jgi:hypothetical protein
MATNIVRLTTLSPEVLTFSDDVDTTGRFTMGSNAAGLLHCLSTGSEGPVTLHFYSMPDPMEQTVTFLLADKYNSVVELEVEPGRCYPLPDELFGAAAVRVICTTEDTADCRVLFKT